MAARKEPACNSMADLRRLVTSLGGLVEKDGVGGYEVVAPPGRRWVDSEVRCYVLPLSEYPCSERLELIQQCFRSVRGGHEPHPESSPAISVYTGYREIRLTPTEAELWDWACSPMHDFWAPDSPDRDPDDGWGRSYAAGTAIVEAKEGVGLIVDDPDVAEDLIYRVDVQIGHMAIEEGGHDHRGRADAGRMKVLRDVAAGKRVAAKVRRAFRLPD